MGEVYKARDLTDAGTVMAVPIRTDTSLEPGRPAALFSAVVRRTRGGPDFEVAGDGQRFLFNQTVADASPITIVLNWTAALKK